MVEPLLRFFVSRPCNPFVITFIKPVNMWSHPMSCNRHVCTCFQSHTLYRFFVSVHQENNSHEAFWKHTKSYIWPKKNDKAWSARSNKKYWSSRKTYVITNESGIASLLSPLLHMFSASHRPILEMKPYYRYVILFSLQWSMNISLLAVHKLSHLYNLMF